MLNKIYQRTQIESKSQLSSSTLISIICWIRFIKEHKLKANHNNAVPSVLTKPLNKIYQRTQIESKSQPFATISTIDEVE